MYSELLKNIHNYDFILFNLNNESLNWNFVFNDCINNGKNILMIAVDSNVDQKIVELLSNSKLINFHHTCNSGFTILNYIDKNPFVPDSIAEKMFEKGIGYHPEYISFRMLKRENEFYRRKLNEIDTKLNYVDKLVFKYI